MGWARFNHWISKCARGSLAQRTRLPGPGGKRRHFKLSWLLWNRGCFAFQALTLCTQSARPDQYPRRRGRGEQGDGEKIQTSLFQRLKLVRAQHNTQRTAARLSAGFVRSAVLWTSRAQCAHLNCAKAAKKYFYCMHKNKSSRNAEVTDGFFFFFLRDTVGWVWRKTNKTGQRVKTPFSPEHQHFAPNASRLCIHNKHKLGNCHRNYHRNHRPLRNYSINWPVFYSGFSRSQCSPVRTQLFVQLHVSTTEVTTFQSDIILLYDYYYFFFFSNLYFSSILIWVFFNCFFYFFLNWLLVPVDTICVYIIIF